MEHLDTRDEDDGCITWEQAEEMAATSKARQEVITWLIYNDNGILVICTYDEEGKFRGYPI